MLRLHNIYPDDCWDKSFFYINVDKGLEKDLT